MNKEYTMCESYIQEIKKAQAGDKVALENLIKNIDGLQSIDDVFSDIKKALEGK